MTNKLLDIGIVISMCIVCLFCSIFTQLSFIAPEGVDTIHFLFAFGAMILFGITGTGTGLYVLLKNKDLLYDRYNRPIPFRFFLAPIFVFTLGVLFFLFSYLIIVEVDWTDFIQVG